MTLVLGVGASSRATSDEITALIVDTLLQQGFSTQDVAAVATLDSKRDTLTPVCDLLGWPLLTHSADELDRQPVPTPSERYPRSVAEAAAQLHGELVVTKTSSPHATLAIARRR